MNGPQDLGGQMGFGPIAPEQDEPIFHADWEKRALGVTLCAGGMGHWNIDESRHARESLAPVDYYSSSYYEIWIKGLETLLERHGFVSAAESAEGRALQAGATAKRKLYAGDVPAVLAKVARAIGHSKVLRVFTLATGSEPKCSIQPAIPGCRATLAGRSERSMRCGKALFFRIRMLTGKANSRNMSIPLCSTATRFGAKAAIPH
jgi:hypothetical protein